MNNIKQIFAVQVCNFSRLTILCEICLSAKLLTMLNVSIIRENLPCTVKN
jgi:hypothetical protein